MVPEAKAEVAREKKLITRARSGCVTCRIRRVKCGEEKPNCDRCARSGRVCDGYTAVFVPRRSLQEALRGSKSLLLSHQTLPGALTSNNFASNVEAVYFDYFRNCTLPSTNACFDSNFWSQTVLQLCHREPAIRHGVLALSSMHQQWGSDASSAQIARNVGLCQYNEAVSHANRLIIKTQSRSHWDKAALETILVACVLFVCFENLSGNYRSAAMHLHSGLEIITKHVQPPRLSDKESKCSQHTSSQEDISEIFERLTLQAMTFGETWLPAEYSGRSGLKTFKDTTPSPMPDKFSSITEARRQLFSQVHWTFLIGQAIDMSEAGIPVYPAEDPQTTFSDARFETLQSLENLDLWSHRFEAFLAAEDDKARTPHSAAAADYLRIYHITAVLLVSSGLSDLETSWDAKIASFGRLVDLVASLLRQTAHGVFSLELGICVPLFVVAQKCRQPGIRRRAIALLLESDRKEGLWETVAAARVGERVMEVEEEGARRLLGEGHVVREAEDVPEAVRVVNIFSKAKLNERRVRIGFMTRPHGSGGEMVRTDEWIHF